MVVDLTQILAEKSPRARRIQNLMAEMNPTLVGKNQEARMNQNQRARKTQNPPLGEQPA
jgi:hypothetical protein